MRIRHGSSVVGMALVITSAVATAARAGDPLPSWNDGKARQSIVAFVERVSTPGSPDFVPAPERIAVFDNDGTLWSEQPMPVQLYFALDRVKALAPQHPEWKDKEPFASLLKGDVKTALAGGDRAVLDLMMATHAGMTAGEFEQIVKDWIATAKHPTTGRLYTDMVYQPMLEVLSYLRANGFKTFIVSGGGIEFMRPWTERVYGIPPEQVVGSSVKTKFEMRDGKPVLVAAAGAELQRRQSRQARRHPRARRPPADRRVRELRGRSADAGVHAGRKRGAVRAARPARRRGARVRLRPGPRAAGRQARLLHARARRARPEGRLDRRQHEGRLEDRLSRRAVRDHRHRHPPAAGRHDARACRGEQRAPARGLPEGFALDAAHHPHITMLQASSAPRTSSRSMPRKRRCSLPPTSTR